MMGMKPELSSLPQGVGPIILCDPLALNQDFPGCLIVRNGYTSLVENRNLDILGRKEKIKRNVFSPWSLPKEAFFASLILIHPLPGDLIRNKHNAES